MRNSCLSIAIAILAVPACAAHVSSSIDANGGDGGPNSCAGSATRCSGTDYQTCEGGEFATQQSCANLCLDGMGCVDCDPSAGSKTCNGADVVVCNADGSFGSTVQSCGQGMMCMDAACSDSCTADGVDLVYAVDEANDFLSFDPRKLLTTPPGDPFTKIGTLDCVTTGASLQPGASAVMPQSMSVDRNGVAWVEYTNGQVFNVSLTTAACTPTAYVPQAQSMALFGMGFSTDTVGGNTEKLFIAGGGNAAQPNGKFAKLDPSNNMLTPTILGTMAQTSDFSPELTGTNQAETFGFFPVLATPAYVQQIDKTTGAAIGSKFNLGTTGLGAGIRDWAFAQWGGTFYVFVTTSDGTGTLTSTVRAITRSTGAYTVVIPNPTFKQIDGAGVSTCAPTTIE